MSLTWRSPRVWINATLGWIAKALHDRSHHPWLKALFGLEHSLDHKESYSFNEDNLDPPEKTHAKKAGQVSAQAHAHEQLDSESEHELAFLNQFTEVFPDLDFSRSSSDHPENNSENFGDLQVSRDEQTSTEAYADQLLLDDQDFVSDFESMFQANDHSLGQSQDLESRNTQALTDHSFQENPSHLKPLPQGITKVKLYDEERERRKAERHKRRRKRRKRRERRERKNRQTQSHESEVDKFNEAYELEEDEKALEATSNSRPLAHSLNTWRRPPLRSLSKWERMGQAQMSQWQRYSPSSKALLFGSWFASLESLVEVDREMKKDREQFYQLVKDHEEFSSFSATELDAWWFQLNRVDYFVTEYQFQKKLEMQNNRPLISSIESSVNDPTYSEADQFDENSSANDLQKPLQVSLPDIKTFDPMDSDAVNLTPIGSPNEALLPNDHLNDSLYPDYSRSIDRDYARAKTIEEDIILRPIKKRKRRSKRSSS